MAQIESQFNNSGIRATRILRYKDGEYRYLDDTIAAEEPLGIHLAFGEGSCFTPFTLTMRTLGDDYNLTLGLLYTEGLIFSKEDILEWHTEGDHSVFVRLPQEREISLKSKNYFSSSACGACGKNEISDLRIQDLVPLATSRSFYNLPFEKMMKAMFEGQHIFSSTGGIHCSALMKKDGHIIYQTEDIGRHNTVDKLVGQCVANEYPIETSLLMVSGRCGFEIIQKAAKASISVVLSIGAPSSLAVELADLMNICIVGFLKKDQHNIYTHPYRVVNVSTLKEKSTRI